MLSPPLVLFVSMHKRPDGEVGDHRQGGQVCPADQEIGGEVEMHAPKLALPFQLCARKPGWAFLSQNMLMFSSSKSTRTPAACCFSNMLLKQHAAGVRVDLLDDHDFPGRTITEMLMFCLIFHPGRFSCDYPFSVCVFQFFTSLHFALSWPAQALNPPPPPPRAWSHALVNPSKQRKHPQLLSIGQSKRTHNTPESDLGGAQCVSPVWRPHFAWNSYLQETFVVSVLWCFTRVPRCSFFKVQSGTTNNQ